MQETRVLVETKGTTGEETISYWFDLPIDVAEFTWFVITEFIIIVSEET